MPCSCQCNRHFFVLNADRDQCDVPRGTSLFPAGIVAQETSIAGTILWRVHPHRFSGVRKKGAKKPAVGCPVPPLFLQRVKSAGLLGLFSFGKASMYRAQGPPLMSQHGESQLTSLSSTWKGLAEFGGRFALGESAAGGKGGEVPRIAQGLRVLCCEHRMVTRHSVW